MVEMDRFKEMQNDISAPLPRKEYAPDQMEWGIELKLLYMSN